MKNKYPSKRKRAHRWGVAAEYLSALWLLCKGYSILAMRHRNHMGEVDIIAARGKMLAFVEVKARAGEAEALESVTAQKRRRIARAAQSFIAANARYMQHDLRFDVMVVTSPWKISHLQNAWRVE